MSRTEDLTCALRDLVTELDDRVQGLPDHPWIPGAKFADGKLMRALRYARRVLDPPPSGYPVHDQLARVSDGTRAVGDFLDWIGSAYGVQLCVWVDGQQEFVPLGLSRETLIGKWSGIDPGELDAEKQTILNQLRERAS